MQRKLPNLVLGLCGLLDIRSKNQIKYNEKNTNLMDGVGNSKWS